MDKSDWLVWGFLLFLLGGCFAGGFIIGNKHGADQYIGACEQEVLDKSFKAYLQGVKEGYKDGAKDMLKEMDEDGKR